MLRILIKSRLDALLYAYFHPRNRKNGAAGSGKVSGTSRIIGMCFLFAYVFWALMRMFYEVFLIMCRPLAENGTSWFYFAFGGVMAFGFGVVCSLLIVHKQLYDARDNDLLLSMPVKPRDILVSRLVMLWVQTFVFEMMILLPLGLAYVHEMGAAPAGVVLFIVTSLLFPMLTFVFTCPVGWVLQLLSAHAKRKTFITTVFSVIFLILYMYFIMRLNDIVTKVTIDSQMYAPVFRRAAYPLYFYGKAMAGQSGTDFLIFALFVMVPFLLIFLLLSRSFIHLATMKKTGARIRYRQKRMKPKQLMRALMDRELLHFSSSSMYMLNGAIGLLFIVILPVVMIFRMDAVTQVTSQLPKLDLWLLAAAGISLISAMNIISAPSVSLEGKNLWIIRSLPVPEKKVLLAKAAAHIVVCIPPVLFASAVMAVLFRTGFLQTVFLFLLPLLSNVMTGLVGVVINLQFPRFDWISETAAVKQSMTTFVSMLVSVAGAAIPYLLYLFLLSGVLKAEVFAGIVLFYLVCADYWCYHYLCTRGAVKFSRLS